MLAVNLVIAAATGLLCFILTPWLITMFALKGQAAIYATSHLRLASCDLLLYALYSPITATCTGIGKSYINSAVSLIELSGRIIFANILTRTIGASCIWWNEPLAWSLVVLFVYIFYFKVLSKKIPS